MNPLFLMLALGGGRGISPGILKAFQTQRKETFNRWFTVIDMVVALILQYVFVYRGEPNTVDASGLPVYSTEAAIKLIQAAGVEGKKHLAWTVGVAKVMETVKALFAPSAQEDALIEMMTTGTVGGTPPGQTIVLQQQPPAPMYAPPAGYRPPLPMTPYGGGRPVTIAAPPFRAQAAYIDDNGNVIVS